MAKGGDRNWKRRLAGAMRQAYCWGDAHIPPGLRTVAGLVLVVAGLFGFLPILGFWMIPVGGVLIALDIPPLRRRLRARLDAFAEPKR